MNQLHGRLACLLSSSFHSCICFKKYFLGISSVSDTVISTGGRLILYWDTKPDTALIKFTF